MSYSFTFEEVTLSKAYFELERAFVWCYHVAANGVNGSNSISSLSIYNEMIIAMRDEIISPIY